MYYVLFLADDSAIVANNTDNNHSLTNKLLL